MQLDYFQKKKTFDPIPGAEGVRMDKICTCMVLFFPFPSYLICNMNTFRNKTRGPEGPEALT